MPQFFVAIYFPEDFDPSTQTEADAEAIHALGREMEAANVTRFACGLHPPSSSKSLRYHPDGKVSITDGPFTETKEYMGGFSVIEAPDLDQAVEWARRGAVACRASGEVRPIFFVPDPEQAPGESK
ncbi:MAG TPA: YciI family protein [Terracidiphilus sp.]|nr:YciI family protein [Terracidiphilus sp.]